MSTTHIAGLAVTIEGRYHRQRCAWCGEILIDDDLANMASPDGPVEPAAWETGRLVRVHEGNPKQAFLVDEEELPDDACALHGEQPMKRRFNCYTCPWLMAIQYGILKIAARLGMTRYPVYRSDDGRVCWRYPPGHGGEFGLGGPCG